MIIDSHAHIGKDIFGEKNGILSFRGTPQEQSMTEFITKMEKFDIKKAIIFPFPSPLAQFNEDEFWYHKENGNLLKDLQGNEERLYFIPELNPKDKKSIDYAFNMIENYKLKGLKIHTRMTQCDPRYLDTSILRFLEKEDIPLVLHIGNGKEEELKKKNIDISLNSAINLAKKYPNNRFVFAHLGRLHKRLEEALRLENVLVDTAALSVKKVWEDFPAEPCDIELIEKSAKLIILYLVEAGYEDKIIWGSDEPYGLAYEEELDYIINNENLEERVKKKILYKNVSKWFKL